MFLLADEAESVRGLDRLPLAGAHPYLSPSFLLRAYSPAERILGGAVVAATEAEAHLQALLARPEVAFVLARFTGHGCYACRIERC